MDRKNIAMVRVTDAIPFDGIVYPVKESNYLKKDSGTTFAYEVRNMLKKEGKLKEIDYSKPDTIADTNKQNDEIVSDYLPYSSDYNSMSLWSLNGMVPEGMNDDFENKEVAIIDGLEEHIKNSEVISINPTDTAIYGSTKLSNDAIILISDKKYETLTDEQKDKLSSLNLKVKTFDGKIEEKIAQELDESERYTSEKLSLKAGDEGYKDSPTKKDLLDTIDTIAISEDIPQEFHYYVVTGQAKHPKLDCVKDEFKNSSCVGKFYEETFYKYLFSKMDIDKGVQWDMLNYSNSSVYAQALITEIEKSGIDEYKKVVEGFNKAILYLKEQNQLPTPDSIVKHIQNKDPIDLNKKIFEVEKKLEEHKETKNMSFEKVLQNNVKTDEEFKEFVSQNDSSKNIETINKEDNTKY